MRSNLEDREDALKVIDEADFFTNEEAYGKYWDIPIPVEYLYVFSVFMEIYRTCEERISFPDIKAWEEIRDVKLTQYEVSTILQMNMWAADEIAKLRDSED